MKGNAVRSNRILLVSLYSSLSFRANLLFAQSRSPRDEYILALRASLTRLSDQLEQMLEESAHPEWQLKFEQDHRSCGK